MKRLNLTQTAIFLVFLVFIGLNSCQKDVLNPNRAIPDKHIVPEYFAQAIAEKFNGDDFFKSGSDTVRSAETVNTDLTKAPFFKSIKNSLTIPDKNKKPAFYIFNYTDGGFVFVSAEFTLQPILAYVPNGEVKRDTVPAGLVMWMEKTIEDIEIVREGKYDNAKQGSYGWLEIIKKYEIDLPAEIQNTLNSYFSVKVPINYISAPLDPDPDPDSDDCINNVIITNIPPLLPVTWGQAKTYNNLINPNINYGCYQTGNDRPWTGCVATAMAQVIRYWKNAPNYNYNLMPSNYGNFEVQKLMFDAGKYVDMHWDCDASWALSQHIPDALKSHFNFVSAARTTDIGNIYLKTIDNLNWGWPVLLGGSRDKIDLFFFIIPLNGHEWVCDGLKESTYPCLGYTYRFFHMNWGWHEEGTPTDYNGWYVFYEWNIPGLNRNYQYANDAIINIHP